MGKTETAVYRYVADTSSLDAATDRSRGKASRLADEVERASKAAGSSGDRFGKYRESLGGAATATSGLSSALAGASGRANDFIGAADNLAMAVMAGGPLAIGLTAAATGAGILVTKMIEAKQRAVDLANTMRKEALRGLKDYEDEVRALADSIDAMGKSQSDLKLEAHAKNVRDASIALVEYDDELASINERLPPLLEYQKAGISQYDKEIARLQRRSKTLEANIARNEGLLSAGQEAIDLIGKRIEKEAELERVEAARAAAEARRADAARERAAESARLDKEAAAMGPDRKLFEDDLRAQAELEADIANQVWLDWQRLQVARRREAEETAKHQEALAKQVADAQIAESQRAAAQTAAINAEVAAVFANTATMFIDTAVTGLIEGNDRAIEAAAAAALASIGQQLIGIGAKGIFEGAIISLNPATPGAGIPMMAMGAAAVAAGAAMGGIGGAWGSSISASAGAASSPSSFDSSSSTSSPRLSSGVGGTSAAAGAPQHVTNVYQFNAPVMGDPNQSARFIAQQQRRASDQLLEGSRR